MKLAKGFSALASAIALVLIAAAPAFAQEPAEPSATYFGHLYVNLITGNSYWESAGQSIELVGDVYNNTNPQAAANFGISSTDLASVWGDRVTTTGMGILAETDFTIFNNSTTGQNLLTANVGIALLDGPTSTLLGSFATGVNFGTGLPPGFFSIVTTTGLSGLNINVNTTDVQIRQQVLAKTGTATRLGIASLDPPTIGSSANTMFITSSTIGGGVPGYYNIGNPVLNANPGYRINASSSVSTTPSTWGKMKAMYH
jgi:hypothetical protein